MKSYISWLLCLSFCLGSMAADTVVNTGVCQGDYCDPSFLPYPNMNAALYGYDLIRADPFSTGRLGGDPGWRNVLFLPTTGSDLIKGAVQLHSSVEARDVLQCAADFKQTEVTNLKKYKEEQLKSASSGYDLKIGNEIEVEVGVEVPLGGSGATGSASAKQTIPPFLTRSSSNTESEKQVSEFFSNEKGSMINLIAACSVHIVDLVPNVVPLFHQGFANAIAKLASASSSTKEAQKYAFKEFYQNYGTHYSQRTAMGSKLVYSLRIDQTERAQNDISEISKCANVQGLKVFGIQAEPNTEKCEDVNKYKSSIDSNYVGRESFASFGSKPASTLTDWAKQKFNQPMPLTMQLIPLPQLFTMKNLEAVTNITGVIIDQKVLLDWYLPMWENFCETADISCKYDAKGCGFNDRCTWDEICVYANNAEGYECQPAKAEDPYKSLPCTTWKFIVKTANFENAQTDDRNDFKQGYLDVFDNLVTPAIAGVEEIVVLKSGTDGWFLEWAELTCKTHNIMWTFTVNSWIDEKWTLERTLKPNGGTFKKDKCTSWKFVTKTSTMKYANTDDRILLVIRDKDNVETRKYKLDTPANDFQRGNTDIFDHLVSIPLSEVASIQISLEGDNGLNLDWAELTCKTTGKTYRFENFGWIDDKVGEISRTLEPV